MVRGLLFITASEPSVASINRLLLYLRWWDLGEESGWDIFRIVTSQDDPALVRDNEHQPTVPPLQNLQDNEFAGKSLAEIEALILKKDNNNVDNSARNKTEFLVLDDKGMEEGSLIVAEQFFTWSEADERIIYEDEFRKTRVPWYQVTSMWLNLDIANMSFEDFCIDQEHERGAHGDYWFTYNYAAFHRRRDRPDAYVLMREAAIDELVKQGLA